MSLIRNVFSSQYYPVDIIAQCERWYLSGSLSLRNLEEIMAERGSTDEPEKTITIRQSKYLNNKGHQNIKRRIRRILGFK